MPRDDHPTDPIRNDDNANANETPLAIRRHTDRCFHQVEEVADRPDGTIEGYIVEGVMIPADEVAQVKRMDDANDACR